MDRVGALGELEATRESLARCEKLAVRSRAIRALIIVFTVNTVITYAMISLTQEASYSTEYHSEITVSNAHLILWLGVTLSSWIGAVAWAMITFKPHSFYQELERASIERGLFDERARGLLSTLAYHLLSDLPQRSSLNGLNSSGPRAWMQPQPDWAMLTLMSRQVSARISALPSLIQRPPWELGVLTLCCVVWQAMTTHLEIVDRDQARGGLTQERGERRGDHPSSLARRDISSERTSTPISTDQAREVTPESASPLSQSDHLLTSSPPRPERRFKRRDQRKGRSRHKNRERDSDPRPRSTKGQKPPPSSSTETTRVRRAQVGGRVARSGASSHDAQGESQARRMRHLDLDPSTLTSTPSHSRSSATKSLNEEERRERERDPSFRGGLLSISESAEYYGITSQVAPLDLPPHLRLDLRQDHLSPSKTPQSAPRSDP